MAISTTIKGKHISIGDTVKVTQKIEEEGKTKTQDFEGIVISIKGSQTGKSFTVRKITSSNIGVERIWPVNCPSIIDIQLIKHAKVRRAKLYYLRSRIGKKAIKLKEKESKKTKQKVVKKAKGEQKTTREKGRRPRPKASTK